MLSRMTIRNRLLLVAGIPVVALAGSIALLRSGSPAGTATLATGLAALGVVAAVGLALAVARTITSPLRRLGEAAERASHLQTLVEALRRPSVNDQALALTPVGLPPRGEIGTVAKAFDDFQGAAARLAVGQAALLNKTVAEKGTIEVFVNLARRMQGLVDHQIEFLDALEAEEQDADTLENLFKLDQLATRVRRNAESLLTLAGAASARSWERPLAMSDVIRAGMAEVEDIGRVDLLMDDNAAMLGNVAADAAHLLSELLENATRWSPPDTRVEVSGTPAAGGYAITIEDRGIGMAVDALAEANHILTGPPLAEATVARSLGLVVAGRLARRLGIVVRLASASSGGIVAKVLVPPTLMVAADETLGLDDAVAGPPRTLPFALARQEKRARISSQRSRGRRPSSGAQPEATITQLPESRWMDEPTPPQPDSHWADESAVAPAPVEPEWPVATTEWSPSPAAWMPPEPQPAQPAWPAAASSEPATEPEWTAPVSWEPAHPEWPEPVADPGPAPVVEAPAPAPVAQEVAPTPVAEVPVPAPIDPQPPLRPRAPVPAGGAEPHLPLPTRVPAAATGDPTPRPAESQHQPAHSGRSDAPEPPSPVRPTPSVRPARFAASSSRSLAGPGPTVVPSAEAKEDDYRRHLERATAAGLVRRVPRASLPKDTGGGATRAPKASGDQPVAERLPDEVRSLLSSYRSGVQRGRADGPEADERTTTPQEQP